MINKLTLILLLVTSLSYSQYTYEIKRKSIKIDYEYVILNINNKVYKLKIEAIEYFNKNEYIYCDSITIEKRKRKITINSEKLLN
jgi:hypothetical protein